MKKKIIKYKGSPTISEMVLKRCLRRLKRLEQSTLNAIYGINPNRALMWDEYFSTDRKLNEIKYPFESLMFEHKNARKRIFDTFLSDILHRGDKDKETIASGSHEFLEILNLDESVTVDEVKKRFRELAKVYHPDHGGDQEKMVEIIEAYHKILGDI